MNHNFQIIESGYQTDYLYSLFIALFNTPVEGSSHLLNLDLNNPHAIYILEMIRMKIIDSIQHNKMIDYRTICRLRIMLYNAGWLRTKGILSRVPIEEFYTFFVSELMDYQLEFSIVDLTDNQITDKKISHISLDDSMLVDGNLSTGISRWFGKTFNSPNIIYSFKELPHMVPIAINTKHKLDIMEAIRFNSVGDKLQRLFIWEIYSMICMDDRGYYSVIRNQNNDWVQYRDGDIPSNKLIKLEDPNIANKISREIRFCFYWSTF